jgi:hypothetical protein
VCNRGSPIAFILPGQRVVGAPVALRRRGATAMFELLTLDNLTEKIKVRQKIMRSAGDAHALEGLPPMCPARFASETSERGTGASRGGRERAAVPDPLPAFARGAAQRGVGSGDTGGSSAMTRPRGSHPQPATDRTKIVLRFLAGDALEDIGRDFGCTRHAVRSIIKQVGWELAVGGLDRTGHVSAFDPIFRQRLTDAMETFLSVLDSTLARPTKDNLSNLREKADLVMRHVARIRIELERALQGRGTKK